MAESMESQEEERTDPTELSIGKLVAWVVGALSILAGVGGLFTQPIIGIGFLIAGVFGMPPTRNMVEDEFNIQMSRWFAVMGYLVILFVFSGLSQAV